MKDKIIKAVCEYLNEQHEMSADENTPLDTCGLDSLDIVDLAMHVEAAVAIVIPDEWIDAHCTPGITVGELAEKWVEGN